MKNISNFFFIFLKIKLELKIIKKKDILIYDEYTADYAKPFFKESITELLDIRYNRINLLILLKSLINKIGKKELTLSQIYILNYILKHLVLYYHTYTNQPVQLLIYQ